MQKQYLQHYGIKGQTWGVRRFQNEDGTLTAAGKQRYRSEYDNGDGTKDIKRMEKDASNDAKEYARAKAYYGEGAGNRRKQIRNRISERMKDPDYKAAFDRHMKEQNMAEHQKAANRERKIEDTKQSVARVGRGIKNFLLGAGTTSLAAISLVKLAQATGYDKKIAEWGKNALSSIGNLFKKKPSVDDYNWQANRSNSAYDDYYRRYR